MQQQWVVTYRIETPDGAVFAEFFRGDEQECRRIEAASCGGDHDMRWTPKPWTPVTSLAANWDAFREFGITSGAYTLVA